MESLFSFWTADTPALGGIERIMIYTSLLLVSRFSYLVRPPVGDSPLQAPELFARTDVDIFFEQRGLTEWIPLATLKKFGFRGLATVRNVLYVSWILCILGLGGQTPVLAVAFSFAFLELFKVSCNGVGHRWYLPMYFLLCLCLANGRRSYSLDAYLFAKHPAWTWLDPLSSHPVFYSGLATKLGLVSASYTLWVGALTKLRLGGWRWLDGSTLAWQTLSSPFGGFPFMKRLFRIPAFACLSAIIAVIFEAGSFFVVFPSLKWLRPFWLVVSLKFHLVIWMTMNPNYLPQCLCYILCVLSFSQEQYPPVPILPSFEQDPVGFVCVLAATGYLFVLLATAYFLIESWPLTCIPMYAYYRGHLLPRLQQETTPEGVHRVGLSRTQMRDLAHEFVTVNPRCIGWLDAWVDVGLVPHARICTPAGQPMEESVVCSLTDLLRARCARSLYRLTLGQAVCRGILSRAAANDPSNPAVAFLTRVRATLQRSDTVQARLCAEEQAARSLPAGPWDLVLCYRGQDGAWVVVGRTLYNTT
jgi:hypothetical protein